MATVTVSELVSRAVAAADMQDNFVSPAQWLYWANVADKKLAVKVAQLGVPYNQLDYTITLNGSTSYSVAEPLAVVAVYFVQSDGRHKKLKMVSPVQRTGYTTLNTSSDPTEFHVSRSGSNLVYSFYPNPSTGTILVRYIQLPLKLVLASPGAGESDTVNYPLGWEDFIVLHMAKHALGKEETINPSIESDLRDCESHIEASASNYMMTDLPKIRDISEDNWDCDWFWPI